MTKIDGPSLKIEKSRETVYSFLSNFENYSNYLPSSVLKTWKANQEECSFTADQLGDTTLIFSQKVPFETIVIKGKSKIEFTLKFQILENEVNKTTLKSSIEADLNFFLQHILQRPVESFLKSLTEKISQHFA